MKSEKDKISPINPENDDQTNELDGEIVQDLEESEDAEASQAMDPLAELDSSLKKTENDLKEQREAFLRYRAETENFKKRLTKEKNDLVQYANEKLIKELLVVYDNMERALAAPEVDLKSLKQGLDMIFKQFGSFLEKQNVKPIVSVGEKFDPSRHEALSQIESETHEENSVVEEYAKGFLLNDRVIIPSKVVVSKKPVAPKKEESLEPDAESSSSENPAK